MSVSSNLNMAVTLAPTPNKQRHGHLNLDSFISKLAFLPPPPPVPNSPTYTQKRPSTAPGLPPSQLPNSPAKLNSFAASRATVRKAPTLNNISDDYQRSKSRYNNRSTNNLLSPTSTTTITTNTTPLVRPTTSSGPRPTSSRRPPASFSANGIETSYGPPPALITRRSSSTYNSDLYRAQNPAVSAYQAQQQKSYKNPNSLQATTTATQTVFSPPSVAPKAMESLDAMVRQNRTSWDVGPASQDLLSPRSARHQPPYRQLSDAGVDSGHSSEDLFLDMATDNQEDPNTDEVTAKLDHFHVRALFLRLYQTIF